MHDLLEHVFKDTVEDISSYDNNKQQNKDIDEVEISGAGIVLLNFIADLLNMLEFAFHKAAARRWVPEAHTDCLEDVVWGQRALLRLIKLFW